jgi:ABC-type transport system involved in cytochrome c biogenesis permease subunit
MTFEPTAVNILVLVAMAAYAAAGALLVRRRAAGWAAYGAGFGAAVGAFVVRWVQVGHVPFQNLYEVFLAMGAMMLPISLVCRRALKVGLEFADAWIGVAVLFPVAFGVFDPAPQYLPPALQSPLFVPHVAAYLAAYVVLVKAAVQAAGCVLGRSAALEQATHRMVLLGFPMLTAGLVLGAYWARLAWDDYWGWDPKELWSLASWLAFLGYLHVRGTLGVRYPRLGSALVVLGAVLILITLLWVNLSARFAGLHSYA